MSERDEDEAIRRALRRGSAGAPREHPADLAWQRGRRRHTRRLVGASGAGAVLVAATAAAVFALGGGSTPVAEPDPADRPGATQGRDGASGIASLSSDGVVVTAPRGPAEPDSATAAVGELPEGTHRIGGGRTLEMPDDWVLVSVPQVDLDLWGYVVNCALPEGVDDLVDRCERGVTIRASVFDEPAPPEFGEEAGGQGDQCADGSYPDYAEGPVTGTAHLGGREASWTRWRGDCADGQIFAPETWWLPGAEEGTAGVYLSSIAHGPQVSGFAEGLAGLDPEDNPANAGILYVDRMTDTGLSGEPVREVRDGSVVSRGERIDLEISDDTTCLLGQAPDSETSRGLDVGPVSCADFVAAEQAAVNRSGTGVPYAVVIHYVTAEDVELITVMPQDLP